MITRGCRGRRMHMIPGQKCPTCKQRLYRTNLEGKRWCKRCREYKDLIPR